MNNMNPNVRNYYNNNKPEKKVFENPEQEKLKNAYDMFMMGVKDYKGLSLEIALDRFEKVKKIIEEVYPKIEKNEKLKETTDKFLNQVKQYITTTEKRIQTKYNFTPSYAYSSQSTDAKTEVARFLKEAELSK